MTHYADAYLEQYQMYTLIIIANIYNLLGALRIFRLIHWIMMIVEGSFDLVQNFMMLLLPLQLAFSFISLVFVGPYVKKYDSITNGFKQQIITMMGQQDSMALMRANYNFTLLWTMLFIIFFAYFFVTSSIVSFEDGFDETVKTKGYPADFTESSRWEKEEFIIWALDWIPSDDLKSSMINKMVKKDQNNAENLQD